MVADDRKGEEERMIKSAGLTRGHERNDNYTPLRLYSAGGRL